VLLCLAHRGRLPIGNRTLQLADRAAFSHEIGVTLGKLRSKLSERLVGRLDPCVALLLSRANALAARKGAARIAANRREAKARPRRIRGRSGPVGCGVSPSIRQADGRWP
jgi:hypothetical protein